MSYEGVTLDLKENKGMAVFFSGLTDKVILTRCLRSIKERHEQAALVQDLKLKKWFTSEMENTINLFFERMNNGF